MLAFAYPAKLLMLGLEIMEKVVDLLPAVILLTVFGDEPSANLVLVGIVAVYILYSPSQTCVADWVREIYFDSL